MRHSVSGHPLARMAFAILAVVAALPALAAESAGAGSARALRDRYAERKVDDASPFGIPLQLVSSQGDGALSGEIDSRLDHRFADVREALRSPQRWCEIMILHPNVKGCRTLAGADDAGKVEVKLGRAEHAVTFDFRIAAQSDDYLDVRLAAPRGPAGTTDYRIRVEATPLDADRTLLHLAYSHGFGMQSKLAMDAYFNTFGRDKVGFTVAGRDALGRPRYVSDLRGGIERNAMRYYLAIRSYVEVLRQPAGTRLEQGLRKFIVYTERWPLQLREEPDFLEVKRRDIARVRPLP